MQSFTLKMKNALGSIGPGFITASLVLGPGSITTASKAGADFGYRLIWLLLLSASFMMLYTTMSTRFGVISKKSLLTVIAENYGRWLSVLIGVSCFMITAAFEFGNNLGVATAMNSLTNTPEFIWPIIFTLFALVVMITASDLYKLLERIMMGLVLLMILAFCTNLIFAKPNFIAASRGLVPWIPAASLPVASGMVATTFSIAACFYQSYLVQEKGWTLTSCKRGIRDSISGISVLGLISLIIILTSAAALNPKRIRIATAADMAIQLEALFGITAKYIFSLGLWAAAFSSFIINAILGGNLLSDGLGLGRGIGNPYSKGFAAAILLIGMLIAVFFKGNIVHALVLAQASTLVAVPACVITLFLISNNKNIMGNLRNSIWQNIWAILGMLLLLGLSYRTFMRLFFE